MSSTSMISSLNSIYGIKTNKGVGGLASGMDTETLIEQMTKPTQSKIAQQLQNKQIWQWKMDSYRGISDKLIEFSQKYMSFTSASTNLSAQAFFGKSVLSTYGENSKFISVSGSSDMAENMSIAGIKQLAQDASLTAGKSTSDQTLTTGAVNQIGQGMDVSTINGKSIQIKYGSGKYNVKINVSQEAINNATSDEERAEIIANALNTAMNDIDVGSIGKKLGDMVGFTAQDGKLSFVDKSPEIGNSPSIVATINKDTLESLGFVGEDEKYAAGTTGEAISNDKITKHLSWDDRINGQTMTFNYNGTSKTIKFDTSGNSLNTVGDIKNYLQDELNKAFGNGRINVDTDAGGGLTFKTMDATTGRPDTTSTLKFTGSSAGLVGGTGLFKDLNYGASNRLNLGKTLADSGIDGIQSLLASGSHGGLTINGKTIIGADEDISSMTVNDLIKRINDSDAGVKVSYLETADKLSIVSTQKGAAGNISIGDSALEKTLFGESADRAVVQGQDAIISVRYAGSNELVDLTRSSNSFNIDGLNITAKGTFGFDRVDNPDGTVDFRANGAEEISFSAQVDTDKIVDAVKSMVDAYNEICDLVNTELTTKRNRNYPPLTQEQKNELSESEIKSWDEKAKQGMLFNDSTLRSLSSDLRFIFSGSSAGLQGLKKMGITVSNDWSENGKVTVDENALRNALAENPDAVRKAFAGDGATKGIMADFKEVTDKYAKTTGSKKGILIQKAGSTHAPVSLLDNSILKEMNSIDDKVTSLQSQLQNEYDRYVKQFSALEQLVAQMNSQSSWFSQMG